MFRLRNYLNRITVDGEAFFRWITFRKRKPRHYGMSPPTIQVGAKIRSLA